MPPTRQCPRSARACGQLIGGGISQVQALRLCHDLGLVRSHCSPSQADSSATASQGFNRRHRTVTCHQSGEPRITRLADLTERALANHSHSNGSCRRTAGILTQPRAAARWCRGRSCPADRPTSTRSGRLSTPPALDLPAPHRVVHERHAHRVGQTTQVETGHLADVGRPSSAVNLRRCRSRASSTRAATADDASPAVVSDTPGTGQHPVMDVGCGRGARPAQAFVIARDIHRCTVHAHRLPRTCRTGRTWPPAPVGSRAG